MKYLMWILNKVVLILSLLIVVIICSAVFVGVWIEKSKWPAHFGNKPENVSYVTEKTDPNDFTFIVVGDVKGGTATFEAMLDIIRDDKPAFAVVLGDVVGNPTNVSHKLFALEMQEHSKDIPMFVVVGNHDVNLEGGFEIADFEKLYGPAQFSFSIGEYLFVILNDVPPYDKDGAYVDYLEDTIKNHQSRITKTFVFMHIPVISIDGSLKSSGLGGSERFMELAEKYNVAYVFAGHHHGYVKSRKGNTNYIISGGGGARLRGEHGKFHHLTRMSVRNGLIEEAVVISKKYVETSELIERNLAEYIWPMIANNIMSKTLTGVIFCLAMVYIIRRLTIFKKRRSSY